MNNYSERLHKVIPGGAHTYSRGDDQFPKNAPPILDHGKGAYIWDADGNRFLDYGLALRAVTLGYDYDPVSEAAIAEIRKGNNLPRASVTELKAAELITSIIPGADMVKFAKNGSTVTTAAVKLARAYTNRKYVAVCAEHPFFTYDDWFIGTTPVVKGIPDEYRSLSLKFNYNNIASLEALFTQYPGQIAAVMLEPAATIEPQDNFLNKVKDVCHKNGTVFILDEMITGFRWDMKGASHYFGVQADLCTFGKGMANGFSLAALTGKREIMSLGGILDEGKERVFLISTTHGAEMCALGAFIKTMEVYKEQNVTAHLWKYGKALMDGMNGIAKEFGIEKYFGLEGFGCSPYYVAKDASGNASLEFKTLFSQEMIRNKVMMAWISLSLSHGDKELEITLDAARKALRVYHDALEKGISNYLVGSAIKPVFRKYN